MAQPRFDPGLTQQYAGPLRRAINKDGSFNVRRRGGRWQPGNLYLALISMSWPRFIAVSLAGYFLVNSGFAALYLLAGADQIEGARAATASRTVANVFFFAVHTFTTVGYGNMVPKSLLANVIASLEAMAGWLWFALNTGLLFARFSRPSARLGFSREALVAPHQGRTALMFRVANLRSNVLMELEAKVLLMTVEPIADRLERRYTALELERSAVQFLPLTWTVVHLIDEASPLWGRSAPDLARTQAELLILIRSFDDSFSQTVHARYSYRYDEIVWGARFLPAFRVDELGDLVLALDRLHDWEPAPRAAAPE